jgi:hypothetical protein
MIFLQLRSGASGPAFRGQNQNDTLLWDTTERKFFVGPGGAGAGVTSFNSRVGVVVPQSGDYDSDEVDNASSVAGASVSDALEHLQDEIDLIGGQPLPTVQILWIDPAAPAGPPTGSLQFPFATIDAAIGALGAVFDWEFRLHRAPSPLIPIPDLNNVSLSIVGTESNQSVGSFIGIGTTTIADQSTTQALITFRRIAVDDLAVGDGGYALKFDQAEIFTATVPGVGFTGPVTAYGSTFDDVELPDATIQAYSSFISILSVAGGALWDCTLGTDLSPAAVSVSGVLLRLFGCQMGAGSVFTFTGAPGQLWLDGASLQSFNDGACSVVNGTVNFAGASLATLVTFGSDAGEAIGQFCQPWLAGTHTAEAQCQWRATFNGRVRACSATTSAGAPLPAASVATLRINGVDTTLVSTIPIGQRNAVDIADVPFVAGDLLSLQLTTATGLGSPETFWTFVGSLTPT